MYYFECLNADHSIAVSEQDIAKNLAAIVLDADRISIEEVRLFSFHRCLPLYCHSLPPIFPLKNLSLARRVRVQLVF